DGFLVFNNVRSGAKEVLEHVVTGANAETQVWNVTNLDQITKCACSLSADSLRFKGDASSFAKYVAFNPKGSGFLSVGGFTYVANQDLHASNGADLVIISPVAFMGQAQRLADLHKQNDGISAVVVTQEQIFNEFSSGTPDPTAIRSFLKMLYDRAKTNAKCVAPRYLLLFGDGCFDNRRVLAGSYSIPHNQVLCAQFGSRTSTYPADDYYGMLADNDNSYFSLSSALCQVAVGRLPVVSAEQAEGVVTKIENYMKNDQWGTWKTKAVIVADDNYDPDSNGKYTSDRFNMFVESAEKLSRTIGEACPGVIQKKVYNDSYTLVSESSGPRYPEVEKLIVENAQNGSMLVNYIGHSNPINWAGEQIFTQSQVSALTNKKQGVWFSASCSFSEYDRYTTSCGESLALAPNGGAIAVVATSRETVSPENESFNKAFGQAFFSQRPEMTIGDVMLAAKNKVNGRQIRVLYPLLGDPALHICFPSGRVVTDSVSTDTAHAFSKVVVKGHIEQDGVWDNSFNGKIYVNVFDKEQERNTKGNYDDSNGVPMVAKFKDYSTILFSGSSQVSGGEFSISFIVPSDIVYSYGNARIAYYACDTENGSDAVGNYSDLVVGGSLDVVATDTVGPQVVACINTPSFRNGDVVGANPVFMARLYDESGINASDVGIGHNITLTVNGGTPISLNDYFTYSQGSCTDGMVTYKLTGLADGVYTLTFKAWDLHNNSNTKKLTFVVENEKGPHIDAVCAYPNPAQEETRIQVRLDRPLSTVDYVVSIFDADGRCVNTLTGSDFSETGQFTVPWNLQGASGRRVRGGVYIYRVELKTEETTFVGSSNKIVVLP
ncbi:MAG: type IX secretion system sortase PorU, partial [Paludibacteraceae bacterium]|nr:type IX secretion system sortase PorU [Paludibacteraceae bacterium]